MMKRIKFIYRWWKWFMSHPSIAQLIINGVDKDTRTILYQRWDEQEPKFRELYT